MNADPRVAVVILNWNGAQDTIECLDSLHADTYANKVVIVVDNGSADGSWNQIRDAHPWIHLLRSEANLGFTGGNNLALKRPEVKSADYVYFLNNDTVSEPDALRCLVAAAESDDALGMLTPAIYYFDQPSDPWFIDSSIDQCYQRIVHENEGPAGDREGPRIIPWASGCAMLIRGEAIRQLRGFDDRFFLIWEDVDLSLRLRDLGSQIAVVPSARVLHKVSRSFQGSLVGEYYHLRNHLLLLTLRGDRSRGLVKLRVVSQHARSALKQGWKLAEMRKAVATLGMCWCAVVDHVCNRYGPKRTGDPGAAQ